VVLSEGNAQGFIEPQFFRRVERVANGVVTGVILDSASAAASASASAAAPASSKEGKVSAASSAAAAPPPASASAAGKSSWASAAAPIPSPTPAPAVAPPRAPASEQKSAAPKFKADILLVLDLQSTCNHAHFLSFPLPLLVFVLWADVHLGCGVFFAGDKGQALSPAEIIEVSTSPYFSLCTTHIEFIFNRYVVL
jgi:hypothetical protein